MTFNAKMEAERPLSPRTAGSPAAGLGAGASGNSDVQDQRPGQHDPEAESLLRRYLSEIHSYRQLGNAALQELETRLAALAVERQPAHAAAAPRQASSILMRPSVAKPLPWEDRPPALGDRLRELSAYLHADLSKQQTAAGDAPQPRRPAAAPRAPEKPVAAAGKPATQAEGLKSKAAAPVLDRIWFEERFAEMRNSIDKVAEKIPTARLDALEAQFHALMIKLGERESERAMAPVEAGLKQLAAYLEDNRHWTAAQDTRMQGVEARLDQLSGLVAQSHAAISATARGLELVAKGTGPNLARATADLVAQKMDAKLDSLNPKGPIEALSKEVATLSAQSSQLARTTDERLRHFQICLDESIDRLNEDLREAAQAPAQKPFDAETYQEDDYDSELITAAQRAARLADGPARSLPQQGEPVRYQIPYGEFLPDEERSHSRTGLIIAAVILLMASAAMLYLNLRDRGAAEAPKPQLSSVIPSLPRPAPPTTASLPSVKVAERISDMSPAPLAAKQVWVTSVIAEETTPKAVAAAKSDAPRLASIGGVSNGESVRKAAVGGDLNAQFSIGQGYLEGKDAEQLPVDERLSKAARWFRRAAENGHAASQYRLATLYELGQGAPKSNEEAMEWYARAAENGHVKAMHNLAVLSVVGNGRSANYLTAAKWFTKAAEHGLRDSQYNLGILYERGLGVERNPVRAYQWFAIAALRGDANAAERRDAVASALADADRHPADRYAAMWTPTPADEAANRAAPEPPLEQAKRAQPVVQRQTSSAQLMNASWSAQIAPRDSLVVEAQRMLGNLGYRPGPVDGILGPRTLAAIREFEKRIGLRSSGQLSESLLAKMAFAVQ